MCSYAPQTYSCLPYGNVSYHLAVTLHALASPFMAFLAHFFPCRRIGPIVALTVAGSGFAGFILATALKSPAMIGGQEAGGALTVRDPQPLCSTAHQALYSTVELESSQVVKGLAKNLT